MVRQPAGALPNADRGAPTRAMGRFDSPSVGTSTSTSTASITASTSKKPGQGIPLLLQHTAGSHGVQFRHLFEMPEITDEFRLIAYDLPFHGKSVPRRRQTWWSEPYRLTRDRDGPADRPVRPRSA